MPIVMCEMNKILTFHLVLKKLRNCRLRHANFYFFLKKIREDAKNEVEHLQINKLSYFSFKCQNLPLN